MSGPRFSEDQQSQARQDAPQVLSAPDRNRAFDPAELLSRIWLQNLPIMRERIASLEAAAREALDGELSPARRTQASDIAHKLAGSLGMFGYPAGTDIARVMERMLEAEGPVDPTSLAVLSAQLRAALPLEP